MWGKSPYLFLSFDKGKVLGWVPDQSNKDWIALNFSWTWDDVHTKVLLSITYLHIGNQTNICSFVYRPRIWRFGGSSASHGFLSRRTYYLSEDLENDISDKYFRMYA